MLEMYDKKPPTTVDVERDICDILPH